MLFVTFSVYVLLTSFLLPSDYAEIDFVKRTTSAPAAKIWRQAIDVERDSTF